MNERLTARVVNLFHTQFFGLIQIAENLPGLHHLQGVVVRGAADKAVVATQIAQGSGNLKPKRLQAVKMSSGWLS